MAEKEIYEEFSADKNSALAAPRGYAKSALIGVWLIWKIVNKARKYIAYIGQTGKKVKKFMSSIKSEF